MGAARTKRQSENKSAKQSPADILDDPISTDPWNAAIEEGRVLDISEFPSALFLRLANLIHVETTVAYTRRHGLTAPEWRILARLHGSSPMQLATLCRVSYFDKALVSRVLSTLASRGLAVTYPNARHRKRRIVTITPKGQELAERVFPDAMEAQRELLLLLTPRERRMAFAIIWKLLKAHGVEQPLPAEFYRDGTE